jgi:hypothetical protein
MRLTVVDGPAPEAQKREWASWTGLPVVVESECDACDLDTLLSILRASGNNHCVLVPESGPLEHDTLSMLVDQWSANFQWLNPSVSPQPEEK